jgi:hypothetical protein
MDERITEPGAASIRSQLDIEQEDPAIFHPYTLDEASWAARVIRGDCEIPIEVRSLVEIGIPLDMMPQHLRPTPTRLARSARVTTRTARIRELAWEGTDPVLRLVLVRRACRMVLARRAADR